MIQVTPHMRILLAVEPADFRCGIDGLARICRAELDRDPFSGVLFVFRNRSRTALKLIVFDGQGFWLHYKRLSKGRLTWWPDTLCQASLQLAAHELQLLLWNGDPTAAKAAPVWKPINMPVTG